MVACPCGSGTSYADCCRPLHRGERPAATAEALMRSRYTAFVRRDTGYLMRTWHPKTRPARVELQDDVVWTELEVRACTGGGPDDDTGTVRFAAHYLFEGKPGVQQETGRFRRVDGEWHYLNG